MSDWTIKPKREPLGPPPDPTKPHVYPDPSPYAHGGCQYGAPGTVAWSGHREAEKNAVACGLDSSDPIHIPWEH